MSDRKHDVGGDESAPPTGIATAWWRGAVRSFVELFCLTGFAIAQPLLDLFGRAPDSFLVRRATEPDLYWFALLVIVVPALGLWLVVQAVSLVDRRAGRWAQTIALGGLIVLIAVQAGKKLGIPPGPVLALLAVALGAGGAVLYRRVRWVKDWLVFGAAGSVVFAALFLVSDTADAVRESGNVGAVDIEAPQKPVSIVMVVFDEWPLTSLVNGEGRIDPQLYPNLAAVADDGAWYRNATTVGSATFFAIPPTLTGRYPHDQTASPTANEYPENLFTLLASQYDLDVAESVTRLCPQALCSDPLVDDPTPERPTGHATPEADIKEPPTGVDAVLSDAWDVFQVMADPLEDAVGPLSFGEAVTVESPTTTTAPPTTLVPTDDAVEQARAEEPADIGFLGFAGAPIISVDSVDNLIASIEVAEQPTLHFLHIQLPHRPFKFLPNGQAYAEFGPQGLVAETAGNMSTEPTAVDMDRQRLLLQVGFIDTLVGEIIDQLRATGLYDESIIVLTSDHGSGFVPGGTKRALDGDPELSPSLYADLLWVPLIVKGPGIEPGTVSDDNVMLIDIVPTLAEMIGIELPWKVDGRSLLGPPRTGDEKMIWKVLIGASDSADGGLRMQAGDPVTYSASEYFPQMLDRNVDTVLRADNPKHRWYNVDDAGELVGNPVEDLTITDDGKPAGTATIDELSKLTDPSEDATIVPARVVGRVTSGGEGGESVAIVVNGVVAGVVPTYQDGADAHHFQGVIDSSGFSATRNDVGLYLVRGREGARTLTALTLG